MTPVDTIAFACTLSRWQGDQLRCRWCDDRLWWNRRVWCSPICSQIYAENHVWPIAKAAARQRDRGCVDCREAPAERPGLLQVDHDPPCEGVRSQSCAHHQDRLFTRCEQHHQERHREIALKSYQ